MEKKAIGTLIIGLLVGLIVGYSVVTPQISQLQSQINGKNAQIATLQS